MTRVLVISNYPEVGSGYGTQVKLLLRHVLRPLYGTENVAVHAFHGTAGYVTSWEGHRVYGAGQDRYGGDIVGMHATHFGADLVISLMDNWALNHVTLAGIHNHVAWMPIDCDNDENPRCALGQHDTSRLLANPGTVVVAMSQFGYRVMQQAKDTLLLPNRVFYVPHMIDTDVFKPHEHRGELRRAMSLDGTDDDGRPFSRFAVLWVAANRDKSRKGWPHGLAVFNRFRKQHPDAILMVHSEESNPLGHDLRAMADRVGLPAEYMKFSAQYLMAAGLIEDWRLAGTMTAADVGFLPSLAEGFGLPIAEMEACGTPVITTDGSSMPEVAGKGGWAVKAQRHWAVGHEAYWREPDQAAMLRALNQAYAPLDKATGRRRYGQAYLAKKAAARPHIVESYSIPVVRDQHWWPVLKQIHDHFGLPQPAVPDA